MQPFLYDLIENQHMQLIPPPTNNDIKPHIIKRMSGRLLLIILSSIDFVLTIVVLFGRTLCTTFSYCKS
jgi:hypothetical protein